MACFVLTFCASAIWKLVACVYSSIRCCKRGEFVRESKRIYYCRAKVDTNRRKCALQGGKSSMEASMGNVVAGGRLK